MELKSVRISKEVANQIKTEVRVKCPPSVALISRNHERLLGFWIRPHFHVAHGIQYFVDFFDERKRTMFLLTYEIEAYDEESNR